MMTMPVIIHYAAVVQMPDDTAADYKAVHASLTAISLTARAGQYSHFESVNREVYEAARQHLQTIEDADGDALTAAIAAAKDWLKNR